MMDVSPRQLWGAPSSLIMERISQLEETMEAQLREQKVVIDELKAQLVCC